MKTLLLSLALVLGVEASAASVKLFWHPNPLGERVSLYEVLVTEVLGSKTFTHRTDDTKATITGLRHGGMYFFKLRAMNVTGWSDFNDALLAEASERFVVTIQMSDSRGTWTDTDCVKEIKSAGAGFFRGKIENIEGGAP